MQKTPLSRISEFGPAIYQLSLLLLLLPLSSIDLRAQEWRSAFANGVERQGAGAEWWSNRFMDWLQTGGRLECREGRPRKPLRTAHLLTCRLQNAPAAFEARLRVGLLREKQPDSTSGVGDFAGFILGVGGGDGLAEEDYRLSSLVHHWPGSRGGLLCIVDASGRIAFRDNRTSTGKKGPRFVPTLDRAWPEIRADHFRAGRPLPESCDLVLRVEPKGALEDITLSAYATGSGDLVSTATLRNLPAHRLSGGIALVSHRSTQGAKRGWWFEDLRLQGSKLVQYPKRAFGPIVATQFTVSEGVLTLTAQMMPLGKQDSQECRLEIQQSNGVWEVVGRSQLVRDSYTFPFRVEGLVGQRDLPYRVVYYLDQGEGGLKRHTWGGIIPKDPVAEDEIRVAAFTGHHLSAKGGGQWTRDHIWHPQADIVEAVKVHDPHLLFFSGDQVYENGLAGIVRAPVEDACLDYLWYWYAWCMAFRDLTKSCPTICLPDDHDVYQGNIWGAGGVAAVGPLRPKSDNGGYVMPPRFVNAVHATQTSHLPESPDPDPIAQGISSYFTNLEFGGVSFAILADRMWKSSPSTSLPQGKVRNGWFQAKGYDPKTQANSSDAQLLGARQEAFLESWSANWGPGIEWKVALSQTIFANIATLPGSASGDGVVPRLRLAEPGEYVTGDVFAADADSNGWPRSKRDLALRKLRKGFALHIAGDQHLASCVQYGVDEHRDGPFALCVPSIANFWPRRWWPPTPGANREPNSPLYTGDHEDGFGNRITVHAVANPAVSKAAPARLHDRMPGYGIVRLRKQERVAILECWPRSTDPSQTGAQQYPGWPVVAPQAQGYSARPSGHLPTLRLPKGEMPVVQVVRESSGETLYTIRPRNPGYRPAVFDPDLSATYTIRVSGIDWAWERTGLKAARVSNQFLEVDRQ